jgi:hypothetical protein
MLEKLVSKSKKLVNISGGNDSIIIFGSSLNKVLSRIKKNK